MAGREVEVHEKYARVSLHRGGCSCRWMQKRLAAPQSQPQAIPFPARLRLPSFLDQHPFPVHESASHLTSSHSTATIRLQAPSICSVERHLDFLSTPDEHLDLPPLPLAADAIRLRVTDVFKRQPGAALTDDAVQLARRDEVLHVRAFLSMTVSHLAPSMIYQSL